MKRNEIIDGDRVLVARTTCCPGAHSAQEVAETRPIEKDSIRENLPATSCGPAIAGPPGQQVVRATRSETLWP